MPQESERQDLPIRKLQHCPGVYKVNADGKLLTNRTSITDWPQINHNQTEVRVDARLRLGAVQERLQRQGSTDGDVQVKVIEYTLSSTCTPVEAYEGKE